ncbi:MAG: M67 family metallopeptidase [Microthrixaceae bacterium]
MLTLRKSHWEALVAHALRAYPLEACGLLVGEWQGSVVERFAPTPNAAASSRIYEVDGRDFMAVERQADEAELAIIGVAHSHTHTDPIPSPTDIEAAPDPSWHYPIVSLRLSDPVLRSWRIADGQVTEEPVMVVDDPA